MSARIIGTTIASRRALRLRAEQDEPDYFDRRFACIFWLFKVVEYGLPVAAIALAIWVAAR